jgi:hypothetical protein
MSGPRDRPLSELNELELVEEAKRSHRAVTRLTSERSTEVAKRRLVLAELVGRKVMSQAAIAAELGVAPQRIGQMIKEGAPKQ